MITRNELFRRLKVLHPEISEMDISLPDDFRTVLYCKITDGSWFKIEVSPFNLMRCYQQGRDRVKEFSDAQIADANLTSDTLREVYGDKAIVDYWSDRIQQHLQAKRQV